MKINSIKFVFVLLVIGFFYKTIFLLHTKNIVFIFVLLYKYLHKNIELPLILFLNHVIFIHFFAFTICYTMLVHS